jgi:Cyclin, N-terminal domain
MALDLLDRLFTYDPAVRITADEALRHPYLATATTAASATVSATGSLSTAAAGDGYHCSDDMLSDDDVEDVYNSTPPVAAAAAVGGSSTSSSSSGAARQRRAQQQRRGLSLLAAAFDATVSGSDVTADVAVDPEVSALLTPPLSSELGTSAAAAAGSSTSGTRQSGRRTSSSAMQTRTTTAAAAAAQRSSSRAPAAAAAASVSNNINVRALLAPPAHLRVPERCSEGAVRYLQHLYAMEARAARNSALIAAGASSSASSSASGSGSGSGGCALRPDHRAMLVDWIVEVIDVFEMCQRTAFLAVNYMDRYTSYSKCSSYCNGYF